MRIRSKLILAAALATPLFTAACVTAPTPKQYGAFRAENPKSVLVVPALNSTVNVDAADYFVSTISRPVAERGYYVFPAHMVKRVLDDDGLSDAGLVHRHPAGFRRHGLRQRRPKPGLARRRPLQGRNTRRGDCERPIRPADHPAGIAHR